MAERLVRGYMCREVESVESTRPMRSVVEMMRVRKIRNLPVLDENGDLVGIVTDRDIRRVLPSPFSPTAPEEYEAMVSDTPIGRVMTREPLTVGPDDSLSYAVKLLLQARVGSLPVTESGRLIGIFSTSDALRAFLEHL